VPFKVFAGFCVGLAGGVIMPLINTVFQRRAPDGLLGRVLGTSTSLAMAAAPFGMLAAGWLAGVIGPRLTLLAFAAVLFLTFIYTLRVRALRELSG
jgi:MFS family permease